MILIFSGRSCHQSIRRHVLLATRGKTSPTPDVYYIDECEIERDCSPYFEVTACQSLDMFAFDKV
jgi:hypothetical protein